MSELRAVGPLATDGTAGLWDLPTRETLPVSLQRTDARAAVPRMRRAEIA